MKSTLAFIVISLAASLALAQGNTTTTTTEKTTTEKAGAPAAGAPNDAQIAHIVVTADSVDVAAGKLAQKMSKNKEVRAFAQRMVTDHNAVNKQATDLAKKLKLKPEDNDTSKALKKEGDDNVANLKKLKGADFDKAYADHEVAYHQEVLDAIDKALLPNAQNPDLKSLLEKTRPAIEAHLEHAKKIQSALEAKK